MHWWNWEGRGGEGSISLSRTEAVDSLAILYNTRIELQQVAF